MTKSTLKAFRWSLLTELFVKGLLPLTYLFMSKFLTAYDYGIYALSSVPVSFGIVIAEFGLTKVVQQKKYLHLKKHNNAFWIIFVVSLIIVSILILSAPTLAQYFGSLDLENLIKILSLQIPIIAFVIIQSTILQENFEFKKIFVIRLLSTTSSALTITLLCVYGYGYWSLVFGSFVFQIFQILLGFMFCQWKPSLKIHIKTLICLLKSSKWNLSNSLLVWGFNSGIIGVLGLNVNVQTIGVYKIAVQIATLAYETFFSGILPVVYLIYCKLQNNKKELSNAIYNITKVSVLYICMTYSIIYLFSKDIINYFFGDKWAGVAEYMLLVATAEAINWLVGPIPNALRAIGRSRIDTTARFYVIILTLFGAYYFSKIGIIEWMYFNICVSIIYCILYSILASRLLTIEVFYLIAILAVPLTTTLFYIILASNIVFIGSMIATLIYVCIFINQIVKLTKNFEFQFRK